LGLLDFSVNYVPFVANRFLFGSGFAAFGFCVPFFLPVRYSLPNVGYAVEPPAEPAPQMTSMWCSPSYDGIGATASAGSGPLLTWYFTSPSVMLG